MALLGSLGNFYVVLLFLFLIGGSGAIAISLARGFWEKSDKFLEKKGGKFMNKWTKLAVTSFAGILIASFALGITNSLPAGDAASAHSSHAGGQMNSGQTGAINGGYGQVNYGQMPQYPMNGSYDARLYQLQVNMMQLQQQIWQLMQLQSNQQVNPWGMGGNPYGGPMYGPNMGNMNQMNPNMNNMSNMGGGGSMSGGMSMM